MEDIHNTQPNIQLQKNPQEINYSLLWVHIGLFLLTPTLYLVNLGGVAIRIVVIILIITITAALSRYRSLTHSYFTQLAQIKFGQWDDVGEREQIQEAIKEMVTEKLYEIFTTFGLGVLISIGIYIQSTDYYQIGLFMISLAVYHFFEYLFCLLFHFKDVKFDSFLINQSTQYTIAMTMAFTEYFIEIFFFPSLKLSTLSTLLTLTGTVFAIIGHYFRAGAEFTAQSNFTHQISFHKKPEHKLVTHGVYSFSRHPGYFGWFLWSVFTQIMIWNPIWTAGFFMASYHFFKSRIEDEEYLLVEFFGNDYIEYQNKVSTRIPFIR